MEKYAKYTKYTKKQKEGIKILKNVSTSEISKQILTWMKKEDGSYDYYRRMNDYWGVHYDIDVYRLPPNLNNMVLKAHACVTEYMNEYIRKENDEMYKAELQKQKQIAHENIPKIMLWIQEEGWNRLTKGNLKLYLSNHEITLKPVVRQELYNEVNKKF